MLLIIILLVNFLNFIQSRHPNVGLNTVELIQTQGFPIEQHYIKTDDNYILGIHRIPCNQLNCDKTIERPTVLLVHGLLSSSADFVNCGPNISLGLILSNHGMDVWLANTRGNAWSRNHTYLDPVRDAKKFWNFSWHEIGYYDLPAMIDYILKIKNEKKLIYVGHSQGTTAFAVMASMRPLYNEKIQLAVLLAPAIYLANYPIKRIVNDYINSIHVIEIIANSFQLYEFPLVKLIQKFTITFCSQPKYHEICAELIQFICGKDDEQLIRDLIPVLGTNLPNSASLKQFYHFAQSTKYGKFAQYNYRKTKNLIKYGQSTPPKYNMSQITAPIALYYSYNDQFVALQDVKELKRDLPNVIIDHLIPYKSFTHLDFIIAKDSYSLLYRDVLKDLHTINKNIIEPL